MADPAKQKRPWLITGGSGQMGRAVQEVLTALGRDFTALDRDGLDITSEATCREALGRLRPEAVINCAAYTKVDLAEDEPELAEAVNTRGPANLARATAESGGLLVHFSTDFVFDGSAAEPYREDDPPGPLSVYGRTKWAGEEAVRRLNQNHLILRTAWLYGPHGPNFVKTMLRLAGERDRLNVVDDQVGSPSYSLDLAGALPRIVDLGLSGTFHLVNSGRASWYEFALKIMELTGSTTKVSPIKSSEFSAKAVRPALSVLNTDALAARGITLRPWTEALGDFLAREGLLAGG